MDIVENAIQSLRYMYEAEMEQIVSLAVER